MGKQDLQVEGIYPVRCKLRNVRIRENALDSLDLPVYMRCGIVGQVFLQFKFTSAVVRVDNVFAVVQ